MKKLTLDLPNEAATRSVGQKLAQHVHAPFLIYFSGPLGAGKTSLIRAFLQALGVQGTIKSPSYALVEPYSLSNYFIYHFDFYRFFDHNEWEESGFRDYFEAQSICLVEWPEKAESVLPLPDLVVDLSYAIEKKENSGGEQGILGRLIVITAHSEQGERVVEKLSV